LALQKYLFAETVADCLELLLNGKGKNRVIAGGTDLWLAMRRGTCNPDALVDITRIGQLRNLLMGDGNFLIGATVTHAEAAASSALRRYLPALSEACSSIGSPQIRNVATLAGNVINARPAADAALALTALGGIAEIVSGSGKRLEPVEDLYVGIGQSKVNSASELVCGIIVPVRETGYGSAFLRADLRRSLSLPVINVAVSLAISEKVISNIRIAVGPVAPKPFRPLNAEKLLMGTEPSNKKRLDEAAEVAAEESRPRDSLLRGSSDYRRWIVKVLVKRALFKAMERTRG
jgi:CO/xanthine dehydrogenase FAD-binding subunit